MRPRNAMATALLALAALAAAPVGPAAAAPGEDLIRFDWRQARVERIGGRFKIVVGSMWLKDFGPRRDEAMTALGIIRHYRLDAQGFVGRPDPSMEYYLADGRAPLGAMAGEDALPFDPENLRVQRVGGHVKLVDGSHALLDFGASLGEAYEALRIIRRHGFDHICFVGRPGASMVYFRKDLRSRPPLVVPLVEDLVRFDPDRARIARLGGRWKIVVGNMILLDFGSSFREALRALRVIRHYRLDTQGFVGRPGPSMEYYLVDGRAPAGPMWGEDSIRFDPANLRVIRVGGRVKLADGGSWLLDFGGSLAEARTALRVIRKYGFTHICYVGRPHASMVYFRR